MPKKWNAHTEREMVEGCCQNDRRSQEILYRQYFATMMGMCMRYNQNKEESMEIVNSGFLRVFQKIDTFAFKGSLEGWIRRLVYHSLADYYKKNNKYARFLILEERDDSISEQAHDQLFLEDILKLVNQLPDTTQRVFRLFAIEGYKHVEIASVLDISVGTSKWHLSEARKKLKLLLEKQNKKYAGL